MRPSWTAVPHLEAQLPLPDPVPRQLQAVSLEHYQSELARSMAILLDNQMDLRMAGFRYGAAMLRAGSRWPSRSAEAQVNLDFNRCSDRLLKRSSELERGFLSFRPPDSRLDRLHGYLCRIFTLERNTAYYNLADLLYEARGDEERVAAFADAYADTTAEYLAVTRAMLIHVDAISRTHPEFWEIFALPERLVTDLAKASRRWMRWKDAWEKYERLVADTEQGA